MTKYTVKDLAESGVRPPIVDPFFNVAVLASMPSPNKVAYAAMHQDYSSDQVDTLTTKLSNSECGNLLVEKLLKGGRGHYGCLEHIQIVFSTGFFPHATMQQARTHRISISFDVQSYRYTSGNILAAATEEFDAAKVEQCYYLRPVGRYTSRAGNPYDYTKELRYEDLLWCWEAAKRYKQRFEVDGLSEEHARSAGIFDYRQHWVVSMNARSAFHFLDLRAKADAAPEIRVLSELIAMHLKDWIPELYDWYEKNRMRKALLAP